MLFMPELPEVETIARTLRRSLLGHRIVAVDVRWPGTVSAPSVRQFRKRILGQTIEDVTRRAKFLHIRLSSLHLLIHLRMSGDMHVRTAAGRPGKHDRLVLSLSDGRLPSSKTAPAPGDSILTHLVFTDARKFGRVWLTADPSIVTGHLGPEPLSAGFTSRWLHDNLRARRRRLKPLLLDQAFLAGLGNIYTDEALHLARLSPLKSSHSVLRRQAQELHAAIQSVLREGIRRNGASIDWVYRGGEYQNHFRVYGRAGKPCPRCGHAIRRMVVGQRGTHVCPRCQRM